jgi:hypothetical protein
MVGRPPTVVTFVVTKNPPRIVKGMWRRYEEKDIRNIGVPVSPTPAGDVCSAAQKRRKCSDKTVAAVCLSRRSARKVDDRQAAALMI